ncbi:MAG: aspartate--tRNA(Asn) ligase [Candidatus Aenigmarchaeota archaeon]|nr:aspartate--tRNA(Asn) ligase [Candidatus Aenigmarchaeota archaeon]
MMRTHFSKDLKPGPVKIAGWVSEKRALGSILFLVLRDHTGLIQVTAKKDRTDAAMFSLFEGLKKETVIAVEGEAVSNKNAPGGIEVLPADMKIIAEAEELPIDMSPQIKTNLDKRLDFRSVDLRRPENQAVFKIQSLLMQEIQLFLKEKGFLQIFTPCLLGVPSEGGSEVFSVVYFDKEAFLRQDPQLHRQLTIAGGFEKIYDIGPAWRAELSHTTRHLTEHRVCAAEMAFIDDEHDIIKLEEEMVIYALKKLVKDARDELKLLNVSIDIPDKFPVLEFPKLYDILDELGEKYEKGKSSYGTEGERLLGEWVKKKYNSDFFFVNRFPFAEKPFYVMRVDDDPTWARSTDLVYRGVELSSGGQREHRYEKIMGQAKEKGMKPESVKWFADFFKYGVPPHGGFALGIERLTMQLLGLKNVREAVLFPRDVNRLVP